MLRVIAVLLLIPLLDALLLVVAATQFDTLSAAVVVLLVVVTALVGMLLVRAEGRHTLRRIQEKLATGEVPTDELVDGGFLVAAGAFFLTPGFVTDLLGLLLALPITRAPIRMAAKRWIITPYLDAKAQGFVSGNVYVGGFPGQGDAGPSPSGPAGGPDTGPSDGPGTAGSDGSPSGFDHDNATDIDFEERDE
ncbi:MULTISPECIES: FxsA family protein [Halomicrobium]|uniref:FxsA cytoplasmic membrane protein n=2 Tax=Halomicrobium mukohataei TaxID=57705 RepID=C7P3M2_HALMD|nr:MULTISPECIES: FxsA family protein [Halomicrobium]ACV47694.1 FxsA cytoplasmic membrane protein [Halomicrobium mukohataei DSM 12286]QCD66147.1 membrane protein FxsA [Halomicrobium mukohataei]QFR20952.1 membrane protein FxsA [Halomicrobium sp. ZPS1]